MSDDKLFNCWFCSSLDDCYMMSCSRCNGEFISNIGYGGYDTEESFWESI